MGACKINWQEIRTDYITSDITLRDLSIKYVVSLSTLAAKSKTEHWVQKRTEWRNKIAVQTEQKAVQKIAEAQANSRAAAWKSINAISEKLIVAAERATEEVDMHLLKGSKTSEIHVNKDDGKTEHVMKREEEVKPIKGTVDTKKLRDLAVTLKELADLADLLESRSDESKQDSGFVEALRGVNVEWSEDEINI